MTGVSEWVKKSDITTAAFPQWTLFLSLLHPSPNIQYRAERMRARTRKAVCDISGHSLKITLLDPVGVHYSYMSQ